MKTAMPSIVLISMLALTGPLTAQQVARPAAAPSTPATAQQQLTPEQQAQVARQDAEISKAAAGVAQLVDTGKVAEVWEGASPVAKAIVKRDDFVGQINSDRQKLGAPSERKQLAVTRAAYAEGGEVPAGNYINVVYATKFAKAPEPVRELISFHLDDDKTWRVSGYSLR